MAGAECKITELDIVLAYGTVTPVPACVVKLVGSSWLEVG